MNPVLGSCPPQSQAEAGEIRVPGRLCACAGRHHLLEFWKFGPLQGPNWFALCSVKTSVQL